MDVVKKKIMIIMPSLTGGGAERVMLTLVKHIDLDKFAVVFVLMQKKGRFISSLDALPKSVEVVDLNASQARYAIFKIAKAIKEIKPDIVFSTLGYLNLLIALIRPFYSKKIKFISRESNTVSIENRQEKYPKLFDFLYKKVYNNFDLIITQSRYMRDDLVENFGTDIKKIAVIYNPVDIKTISEKSTQKTATPLKKEKINLLAVGRLSHQKGFDVLVEMMSKLDDRFHLNILGEGEDKKALEQQIKELKIEDKVTLLGFCDNPYAYMKESDFFILSSRYEGLPNVVLEANACGLATIAFNTPGGTAEIIEDRKTGILVDEFSALSLAENIELATHVEFDKTYIYDFCKRDFSVQKIVREYEHYFLTGKKL